MTLGLCVSVSPMMVGCNSLIATNVADGLKEGAITTAAGIINAVFGDRFLTETSTETEGSGNDSFVQI